MCEVQILVGSTLGTTEFIAEAIQQPLNEAGLDSEISFDPDLNSLSLGSDQILLFCLSTHGAGDYPENFKAFMEQLQQVNAYLSEVKYGIIGVGDSNYDTFCDAAKNLDYILEEMGAIRVGDRLEIDISTNTNPERLATDWIQYWIEDLDLCE